MSLTRDLYLSRRPLAGFIAIGLGWSVYFAQMPTIKANVGASDGAYGTALLLAAFGALAAMWLAPACRALAGRFAVALGILAMATGMCWAGVTHSLIALTFGMFIASAGSGVIDVLVNARVSEVEEQSKTTLMNLNHAIYAFAYAAGAGVTAIWRSMGVPPLPIFAGLMVVLLALAWLAQDDVPAKLEESEGVTNGFPSALVVITGLIILAAFLAEASTEGWSALHLERTLGGQEGVGALGPALLGFMMGIGRLSGHWLARRLRDTLLMLLACVISALGILAAGLASNVIIGLAGFAVAGLGISVVAPLALALIGRVVNPAQRLAAISRASVIGYGAFFFGPPLMGLIAEGFGLRTAFVAVAGLLAVTSIFLIPALARRAAMAG